MASKKTKKPVSKKSTVKTSVKTKAKKSSAKKLTVKASTKSKTTAKPKTAPKLKIKAKATAKKVVSKKPLTKLSPKMAVNYSLPETKKVDLKSLGKKLLPLQDRVACVAEKTETRTASGLLIIPDTVSSVEGYRPAQVIACGKGARNKKGQIRPLEIKVGDRVLLPQYAGTEIEVDGVKIILVREKDLLGYA